jgi:hypothetical protein
MFITRTEVGEQNGFGLGICTCDSNYVASLINGSLINVKLAADAAAAPSDV